MSFSRRTLSKLLLPTNHVIEGRLWGYARVSTDDQKLDLQLDALNRAGVITERIYVEKLSGARSNRPELAKVLKQCREGDTLIVWRLDRLGRSLLDLLTKLQELERRGVKFRSLTESIDTGTAAGRLIMHVVGAIAEFERQLTRERTKAGVAAHRARGGRHGAPQKLNLARVEELLRSGKPVGEVAKIMRVFPSGIYYHFPATVCRRLAAEGPKKPKK